MNETRANWWMDDRSRWHRGLPPAGWWQAEDGRWHPADDDRYPPGHDGPTQDHDPTQEYDPLHGDDDPVHGHDPTQEIGERPFPGAAHLAGGPRSAATEDGWGWPPWARIAVLAAMVVIATLVVGLAALTDDPDDSGEAVTGTSTTLPLDVTTAPTTAGSDGPRATSAAPGTEGRDDGASAPSTSRPAPSATTASPQTPSAPATTTPPPSAGGIRPGAGCSPEGATALSQDGVPMTCTTHKCHGAPFETPRWRRTAC